MKYLALIFTMSNIAYAAPATFNGYCMVVEEGNPPGKQVSVQKGTTEEIARLGSLVYSVTYGDMLNEKDVLQLRVFDTAAGKQSVADVFVENEFPRRVDLVSGQGSMMCNRD